MNIREIQPADGPAFKAIRLTALLESPAAFGATHAEESQLSDEQWEKRARFYCEDANTHFVLGFDGESTVAMAGAYRDKAKAGVAHLYSVWTAPAWRGRGESRQMIATLERWALVAGMPVLEGWVTEGNSRAFAFYRKIGFTLTDESARLRWDASVKQILIRKQRGSE
jgi:GNAT superfamily N-acetyltransferase